MGRCETASGMIGGRSTCDVNPFEVQAFLSTLSASQFASWRLWLRGRYSLAVQCDPELSASESALDEVEAAGLGYMIAQISKDDLHYMVRKCGYRASLN